MWNSSTINVKFRVIFRTKTIYTNVIRKEENHLWKFCLCQNVLQGIKRINQLNKNTINKSRFVFNCSIEFVCTLSFLRK